MRALLYININHKRQKKSDLENFTENKKTKNYQTSKHTKRKLVKREEIVVGIRIQIDAKSKQDVKRRRNRGATKQTSLTFDRY